MSDILFLLNNSDGKYKLTSDIVYNIKLFTGELVFRNGKHRKIGKLSQNDPRYEILQKRPRIRQILNSSDINREHPLKGSVWFKINGKFMVINVGYLPVLIGNYNVSCYSLEIHYKGSVIYRQIL